MDRLHLLLHFWRLKLVLVAFAAVGLALGIFVAHRAKPVYAVSMTIGPPQSQSQSPLATVFSSSLAGQLLGGAAAAPAPYLAFLQKLTSADVAEDVARDSDVMQTVFKAWWDPVARKWRAAPRGIGASIKAVLGLPPAHPPTAYELGRYLQTSVKLTPVGKTTINRIEFRATDPEFGVRLLNNLVLAADRLTKDQERARLDAYLTQIDKLLATVQAADIRAALTQLYSRTEEERMLIVENQLYSVSVIDSARASSSPVSPSFLQLAKYTAAGLVLGVCCVLGYTAYVLLSASLAAGLTPPQSKPQPRPLPEQEPAMRQA